jgi:hypothetical protein
MKSMFRAGFHGPSAEAVLFDFEHPESAATKMMARAIPVERTPLPFFIQSPPFILKALTKTITKALSLLTMKTVSQRNTPVKPFFGFFCKKTHFF